MVEVRGLCKTFPADPPVVAVDDVSFTAKPGQVFALLGANGAGKTTTLRMLVTLLTPDKGDAIVCGHSVVDHPEKTRANIGYLSTTTGVYPTLTPREMLTHFGKMMGLDNVKGRVDSLIDELGLGDYQHQRNGRLSTGNAQKVSIARAVLHDPAVLIFDEPTSGLDVMISQTFLDYVERARDQGKCVIYSTHIMREVERLCDQVAILHKGRIVTTSTVDQLKASTGATYLEDAFVTVCQQAEAQSSAA